MLISSVSQAVSPVSISPADTGGDNFVTAAADSIADLPLTAAELRVVLAPFVSEVWPYERVSALYHAWRSGIPAIKIGVELKATKNAVIGKIHRLAERNIVRLRANPSVDQKYRTPEMERRRHADRARVTRECQKGAPLREYRNSGEPSSPHAPVASAKIAVVARAVPAMPRAVPATRFESPARLITSRPAESLPQPSPAPVYVRRSTECCWPVGTPRTKSFHFCDLPTVPGKPYCGSHFVRAYKRVSRPADAPDLLGPVEPEEALGLAIWPVSDHGAQRQQRLTDA